MSPHTSTCVRAAGGSWHAVGAPAERSRQGHLPLVGSACMHAATWLLGNARWLGASEGSPFSSERWRRVGQEPAPLGPMVLLALLSQVRPRDRRAALLCGPRDQHPHALLPAGRVRGRRGCRPRRQLLLCVQLRHVVPSLCGLHSGKESCALMRNGWCCRCRASSCTCPPWSRAATGTAAMRCPGGRTSCTGWVVVLATAATDGWAHLPACGSRWVSLALHLAPRRPTSLASCQQLRRSAPHAGGQPVALRAAGAREERTDAAGGHAGGAGRGDDRGDPGQVGGQAAACILRPPGHDTSRH